MKVVVTRSSLFSALSLASSIANERTPKPVLACVLLTAQDGKLEVRSTDIDTSIEYEVTEVQVEQEGSAAVNAARILEIVKNTVDPVTLEANGDEFFVRSDGAEFQLFTVPSNDYPPEPTFEGTSITLPLMAAQEIFGKVKDHVQRTKTDDGKPGGGGAFCGVYLCAEKGILHAVGTDARVLSDAWTEYSGQPGEVSTAVVSTKTIGLVMRLDAGKKIEESPELKITFNDNAIIFESDGARIRAALIEGVFPNWEAAVSWKPKTTVPVSREAFAMKVKQSALFSTEEHHGALFEFSPSGLTLTSADPRLGRGDVRFLCKVEGDPITIGLNPSKIVSGLNSVKDAELKMLMTDRNKPAMLVGEKFRFVVMPLDLAAQAAERKKREAA